MADVPPTVPVPPGPPELHTVADDHAVAFAGAAVHSYDGLRPATEYAFDGLSFRTLPRPGGELLATVATVNDVHFGETECGRIDGHHVEPVLRVEEGDRPYPEVMNAAVVAEIAAAGPDAVVAKGDLTCRGTAAEYAAFEAVYRPPLGARLVVTRGNHDHPATGPCFEVPMAQFVDLPGVTLAVLDTSRAGEGGGFLDATQLEELDERLSRADQPVLVFGHHPVPDADADAYLGEASGLDEVSTAALVEVAARRPAFAGYFAGHTHRNLVRRFAGTGEVPFAEVACTKDFPGSWAEYRVWEGGILAVHHRVRAGEALAWSERCRAMFFGLYPRWALGTLQDRCFVVR